MNIQKISFNNVLKLKNRILIDVRTSEEYNIDHIPGGINLPLLDEEERKKIGILYKTKGSLIAKRKGVDIVTPKLQKIIDELLNLTEKYENVVFYCSRGGLRSYSMASFFSMVSDKKIFTIENGYKGYRRYVLNFFDNLQNEIKGKFLVVDGLTGSGKTIILKKIKDEGFPVIDLEELATHRGSAFGKIGIKQETNQKRFESMLWSELYNLRNEKIIIIEGESKKIGRINLPEGFYSLMNNSPHIWLECPMNLRIKILKEDYLKSNINKDEIKDAIIRIKEFIGKKNVEKLIEYLEQNNFDLLIKELLEKYYDKLYHKKRLKDHEFYKKIKYSSIEEGISKVKEVYNEILRKF